MENLSDIAAASPAKHPDQTGSGPSSAPPQSPPTVTARTRVLGAIITKTRAADVPPSWYFLGKSERVRQLCGERQDLVTDLRRDFSDDELCASRVVFRVDENLHLNKVFGDESNKFLILLSADKLPINVVSARGELATANPPVVEYVMARRALGGPLPTTTVLVATTDDDLQIAHGLGFPTTSAAGLARLTGAHVRKMFVDQSSASSRRYELVLPAWQLAPVKNTPTVDVAATLAQLMLVGEVFNYNPETILTVWRPVEKAFKRIKSSIAFSDVTLVRSAFENSMAGQRFSPVDWGELRHELHVASTDLPTARQHLRAAIDRPGDVGRLRPLRQALQRLRHAMQSRLVDKFWQAIEATNDPVDCALLFVGAELVEHLTQCQPLVDAAETVLANRQLSHSYSQLGEEALAERLKLGTFLIQLRRAIEKN